MTEVDYKIAEEHGVAYLRIHAHTRDKSKGQNQGPLYRTHFKHWNRKDNNNYSKIFKYFRKYCINR